MTWNVAFFLQGGNWKGWRKDLVQRLGPTTNSTWKLCQVWNSHPGYNGRNRDFSPLRHSLVQTDAEKRESVSQLSSYNLLFLHNKNIEPECLLFSAIHISLLHARPSSYIFLFIPLILTFFYLYSQHFRVLYSPASKKMTTTLQHISFKYETLCFCSYVLNINWVSFSS